MREVSGRRKWLSMEEGVRQWIKMVGKSERSREENGKGRG